MSVPPKRESACSQGAQRRSPDRRPRPGSAARSSSVRSAACSRSTRAASSARTVAGTPPSPSDLSAAICSTNNGTPAAASTISRRFSGSAARDFVRREQGVRLVWRQRLQPDGQRRAGAAPPTPGACRTGRAGTGTAAGSDGRPTAWRRSRARRSAAARPSGGRRPRRRPAGRSASASSSCLKAHAVSSGDRERRVGEGVPGAGDRLLVSRQLR